MKIYHHPIAKDYRIIVDQPFEDKTTCLLLLSFGYLEAAFSWSQICFTGQPGQVEEGRGGGSP